MNSKCQNNKPVMKLNGKTLSMSSMSDMDEIRASEKNHYVIDKILMSNYKSTYFLFTFYS